MTKYYRFHKTYIRTYIIKLFDNEKIFHEYEYDHKNCLSIVRFET